MSVSDRPTDGEIAVDPELAVLHALGVSLHMTPALLEATRPDLGDASTGPPLASILVARRMVSRAVDVQRPRAAERAPSQRAGDARSGAEGARRRDGPSPRSRRRRGRRSRETLRVRRVAGPSARAPAPRYLPGERDRGRGSAIGLIGRKVERSGVKIDLTQKEFARLEYRARHASQVMTRTMLAEHVWDMNFDRFTNVIDVYIRSLRRKVDEPYEIKRIHI
jgi:hypothetical protein